MFPCLMVTSYRSQRATTSLSDSVMWVVVDDEYELHQLATDCCLAMAGADRATNTLRSYSQKIAKFLTWCSQNGLDWTALSFADLTRYKRFIEREPMKSGETRSAQTTNLYLIALCEFLRFASNEGVVDRSLIDRLSQPKFLRFLPKGFDPGHDGRRRAVRVRTLKVSAYQKPPEFLEPADMEAAERACRNTRDTLLLRILHDSGLRIGEALGLRRSDMHLLPDSSILGCAVVGPHVHVQRRLNANGSTAKSRYPRHVPVSRATVGAYSDYCEERETLVPSSSCDFLLINLYGGVQDSPMSYSNAKRCINRIASVADITLRPHMLRHTAATNWLRNGERVDTVQELLGHVSAVSTQVYLHPSSNEMRAAVDNVSRGREANE